MSCCVMFWVWYFLLRFLVNGQSAVCGGLFLVLLFVVHYLLCALGLSWLVPHLGEIGARGNREFVQRGLCA